MTSDDSTRVAAVVLATVAVLAVATVAVGAGAVADGSPAPVTDATGDAAPSPDCDEDDEDDEDDEGDGWWGDDDEDCDDEEDEDDEDDENDGWWGDDDENDENDEDEDENDEDENENDEDENDGWWGDDDENDEDDDECGDDSWWGDDECEDERTTVPEPTETMVPTTAERTETTAPTTAEPTETTAPTTAEPTETTAPTTAEPTETAAPPTTAEPTETAAPPTTAEPTESTTRPPSTEPRTTAASTTASADSSGGEEDSDAWEGVTVPDTVGVPVTTTDAPQAVFYVRNARTSMSAVRPSETLLVSATVANRGDGAGEFAATLVVDGTVRRTHEVSLAAGERTTVRFRLSLSDLGPHAVAVNSHRAGTVSVEAADRATSAESGPVSVSAATVRADWVQAGRETAVSAEVSNPTDRVVRRAVAVTVDGAVVARRTVVLAPGERTRVVVPFEAVEGDVAVDGVPAGRLSVSAALGAEARGDPPAEQRDDGGSGGAFPVWAALVATVELALVSAIVVAAGLDRRRSTGRGESSD
ncbi:hypothetical protein G9C85_05265 [Halorubellus sp. JP-L1]|uniref:CARDB domain-containing protein n=1 Tax=Halorubellus sp. JP-L1 TaxID=2715753 RepID=UPI00140D3B59|nr:CARDB domain-containing protein [Halorubellus sp. JP-L1]NHN41046.1 hypothetical protein [Halorubellus sp. JP-L1]